MNNFNLVGRLTSDPKLTKPNPDLTITTLTLAVNRNSKEADFIFLKAFNKIADNIEKYCKKGSLISVTGHIHTSSYTGNDGNKIYNTDLIIDKVNFLSPKSSEGESTPEAQGASEYTEAEKELPF